MGPSLFILIALIAGLVKGIRIFARRRNASGQTVGTTQLLFTSAGASARGDSGPTRFVRWAEFRKFRFRRVGPNEWRLRLLGRFLNRLIDPGHLRRVIPYQVVQAYVQCTPREAALVRGEIRRRMQAVSG